jgi:glycosyltransferase involved in cell wall biosynthesis
MGDAPLLEVMLPFWGDPQLLYDAVESVRSQEDARWWLTIVDDCYPDESVAAHFAAETDPRIRYVRHEVNLGITANYEACRDLAQLPLMMFLGCDDLMLPGFVSRVLALHARHPDAGIIQPGVRVIDEHGDPAEPLGDKVKRALRPHADAPLVLRGERLATSLLHGNWLYWPSLVFRTEVIRRYPFRDGLPIIQDMALVVDMAVGGESLVLDSEVVFAYRRHTESASSASLLTGRRLPDERTYYAQAVDQMAARGWPKARRAARLRWTSRLHGLTLVPAALKSRDPQALRAVVRHAATLL